MRIVPAVAFTLDGATRPVDLTSPQALGDYQWPSGMTCARRPADAQRPVPSSSSPRRPNPRPGCARLFRLLPALALLLGGLSLFAAGLAEAQTYSTKIRNLQPHRRGSRRTARRFRRAGWIRSSATGCPCSAAASPGRRTWASASPTAAHATGASAGGSPRQCPMAPTSRSTSTRRGAKPRTTRIPSMGLCCGAPFAGSESVQSTHNRAGKYNGRHDGRPPAPRQAPPCAKFCAHARQTVRPALATPQLRWMRPSPPRQPWKLQGMEHERAADAPRLGRPWRGARALGASGHRARPRIRQRPGRTRTVEENERCTKRSERSRPPVRTAYRARVPTRRRRAAPSLRTAR